MRWRFTVVLLLLASLVLAREGIHYVRWNEIQPLQPEITDSKQWDAWIRQRDFEIRSSIDRCLEDSISMLIIFGTSFTALPRLQSPADAVTAAGGLTSASRLRMDAFISGLDQVDDERFRSILQFLRRRQIAQDELRAYLDGNLRRAALERGRIQHMHGVSLGATVITQTLRGLMSTGKAPGRIRRIGVIGPGLDPEYDPNTDNLFASVDAALSSGLTKPGNLDVVVLDINPWVLAHVRAVAAKAGGRFGAHIHAEDLNVVTQTSEGQGFDLVVAATGLNGFSRTEQMLVMANVAQMMASGGIFLTSGGPYGTIPPAFEVINVAIGEGITVYRRR
jgi:hypothetical protein